eukprot:7875682-Alexandrium_andersonii.AAC.1
MDRGRADAAAWAGLDRPGGSPVPDTMVDCAAELRPQGKKGKSYVVNVFVCAGALQTCKRPLILTFQAKENKE